MEAVTWQTGGGNLSTPPSADSASALAVRPAAIGPLLGRRPVVERAAAATLPAAAATNGAPCPQRDEHDGGPAADLWHAARQALPFRTTVPTASHTLPMPSSC